MNKVYVNGDLGPSEICNQNKRTIYDETIGEGNSKTLKNFLEKVFLLDKEEMSTNKLRDPTLTKI